MQIWGKYEAIREKYERVIERWIERLYKAPPMIMREKKREWLRIGAASDGNWRARGLK